MSVQDFVQVTVSISNPSSPSVQGLTTPLIATFHTHYPDRVRVYSAASMLTQMVADGFSTSEAAYKAAEAILAAPNGTPAQVCIGRRVNVPLQTLQLKCVDGTVNDQYSFTVVGSDGHSHLVTYTNVANPGPAIPATNLSGTATVTRGSTTVTFSSSQTLAAGQLLTFSNQTGVSYAVATATTASLTATLTTAFTGASASSLTVTPGATTSVTNGSTSVTFSTAQSLAAGALLTFAAQPGVYYALAAVVTSSTSGTLTQAFQGPTTAASQTQTVGVLAGTFGVTNGSAIVSSSASQVAAVNPGDSLVFAGATGTFNSELALNTSYTVLSVSASQIILTQPYTGTTNTVSTGSLACQSTTAAANLQYQLSLLSNLGTPTVASQTVTLSRTDGFLNDIQFWLSNGFASIQLTDATADPGITADLTAIRAANNAAWYGLVLDSNSAAEIEAAALWTEATSVGGKVFFSNNSDYGNWQTSVTSDVFSLLQLDSYKRTFIQQNNQQLLCYAGAATCGQALAMNPGSYTLAYKTLPGVPADSDTTLPEGGAMALNSMTAATPGPGAKNGNYYKTIANVNWLFPGTTPSGQFMDLTIGIDWLQTRIQQAVLIAISGLPKTPFTDIGIGRVKDAIDGVLRLGATPAYGLILPDGQDPTRPISVIVPTAASLSSAARATRNLSGVSFSCGLQGAIETVTVQGTLEP